mgnify:FL=1
MAEKLLYMGSERYPYPFSRALVLIPSWQGRDIGGVEKHNYFTLAP